MMLGAIWFVSGYAIVSNIFPLDMTIAERWLYFPMIGALVYLAGLAGAVPMRVMPLALASLAITIAFTLRTIARTADWRDGLSLYRHDSAISKNSFDLENNLGVELFRIGRYEAAKAHFERSIALQPAWYFAYNNLGAVYERQANNQRAKELYLRTLDISDYYLAYENAAVLTLREGNLEEAKQLAERGLKKLPGNARLRLILSEINAKLKKEL